jgi:hypothetical protein
LYRREKCAGELTGVEAVFVEENESVVAGVECGYEVGELCGGEFIVCGGDFGREGLQGGVSLEGNANAGENVKTVKESGIE